MAVDPIIMPDASSGQQPLDDALAAYTEYSDWEEYRESDTTTAVSRCRLFVTACVRLIGLMPKESETRQRTRAVMSPELIQQQLAHARRYLAIAGGSFAGDGTEHVDLTNFRD